MSKAGKRWSLLWLALFSVSMASAQFPMTPTTFTGTTAVGSSSQPLTISLTAQASGVISSVVALTTGAPGLDFAVIPMTCAVNTTLNSGGSCSVQVIFSPRYPGVRQGAILIKSGGQLLAEAVISASAQGSLPVLVPSTVNTVAGNGQWIYQDDGIAATQAPIFLPAGLAVDGAGNLFLCDSSNDRVRRVDAGTGLISTVAGNGSPGLAGDDGLATSAQLNNPSGLVVDGAGNLFIADSGNNSVRRVDAVSGVITTFAGQPGLQGYSGNGAAAVGALLTSPRGLALTAGGDLVIADSGNSAVRLVTMTTQVIVTIAGTGVAGFNADGIAATQALLNEPYGVAVRSDGAIAIADLANQRVRLVNAAGIISTLAGTGQLGFSGDGGLASQAQLNTPADVAFDPAGDLFIADSGNNRVRVIFGNPGAITTLIGTSSQQFGGDGGPSSLASLYGPYAVVFDPAGNLWLSDTFHNRVREINGTFLSLSYPAMKVGNLSPPILGSLFNGGNINLYLGAPVLNQASLDANTTTCNQLAMAPSTLCSMGVDFAPAQVSQPSTDPVTGSITWSSNAPNVVPVDALSGVVLSVDVTSVALASSVNPGLVGQSIILTATISSDDTGRTGSVTFSENGNPLCQPVLLGGTGTAACVVRGLSLGSHILTASYSGDANNASSTSTVTEIIKQSPALVLAASPNPAVVMGTVTITLTAVDSTSGTPTGAVTFYNGPTALGSASLNTSGIAQWTTSTLSVGAHILSAKYAGDGANAGGASNAIPPEEITQAVTTTGLLASVSNATVGSPVVLTASVSNSSGPPITGSVTFTNGTTSLGTALLANGTASLTLTTLTPGSYSIVATYGGDTDNAPSHSTASEETIQQIVTVTALAVDMNPVSAGATLSLTASVSSVPGGTGGGILAGSVTFHDGSAVLGTMAIGLTGQAVLAVNTLSFGSHALTAAFDGNTNYSASTSNLVTESVQQTPTQSSITSAATTTLMGKPALFTLTVTSMTGTPPGQATFRDTTTVLGMATLNASGQASYSLTTLSHGIHSITGSYGGTSSYTISTSSALQQTVQLAQPTLTLSGPTSTLDAGTVSQFTAILTSPGVTPTGTLSLMDGSSSLSTQSVSPTGSFVFSISALAIGSHTLTAAYNGDASNSGAVSNGIPLVVRQASTSATLVSNVDPLTEGASFTLTASVSSDSPNATGLVRFLDSGIVLGVVSLGANGTATLSPAGLAPGSHSLTAVYAGDTNHATSSTTTLIELVVQNTTAVLASSNNPAASGQSVIFTARISGSARLVPTGTVTLRDNGNLLATVSLDGTGSGIVTTSALGVGSHTITISYPGDGNFSAAGAQMIETITDATTRVSISANANPATFGQPVTIAASLTTNGGTATGGVDFIEAGATIGSAHLNANGVAALAISTLSPGAHTIVAAYLGSSQADPAASVPLVLAIKQNTAITLNSSGTPTLTLSPLSFTAGITNAGAGAATGAVSFNDGTSGLGSAQLDASGHATLSLPGMSAGTHIITAVYAGDSDNFSSTSSSYDQAILLRPTVTTLTGPATDISNPQQVTLISVVESQPSPPGPTSPTGSVTFLSGDVTLGQAAVGPTGVATLTVVLTQQSQLTTASYGGDVSYAASQSARTTIIAGAAAQFTLAASTSSTTLITHQHTTLNVTVGSVKGFTDTISLGCLGLPFAATCTFAPSQISLSSNGTVSAVLALDTGDPLGAGSGATASTHRQPPFRSPLMCWLPLGLLAGLLPRKAGRAARQRVGLGIVFISAIGFATCLVACSGLSTSGTPTGTYTFKIVGTGQGSGLTETQTITLNVTK